MQFQEEDVFRAQRNFLENLVGRSAAVGQPNLTMWPLFYHVADMVRVFLLCEFLRPFYHVADMVRAFLHLISQGLFHHVAEKLGYFLSGDLKALLPSGRHG
jgi:hypothetical protein